MNVLGVDVCSVVLWKRSVKNLCLHGITSSCKDSGLKGVPGLGQHVLNSSYRLREI